MDVYTEHSMTSPTKAKKSLVVVKTLEMSPKRKIFVAREPQGADDFQELTQSNLGNTSPKRPERTKDGTLIPRSVLGSPEHFEKIEGLVAAAAAERATPTKTRRQSVASPKKTADPPPPPPEPAHHSHAALAKGGDHFRTGDLVEDPSKYLTTLRDLRSKMYGTRKQSMQRRATLSQFLPIVERLGLNKEGKILAKWQERQREWDQIAADISMRLSAPKHHALLMSKTDEFRARAEEYGFIRATVPASEARADEGWWEWSLRGSTTRVATVGHTFSGLSCEVSDVVKPPIIMRKPKPMTDLLARTNPSLGRVVFVEETKALKEAKAEKHHLLKALRPREVTLEDAAGLYVRSTDIFQWAIDSSSTYFQDMQVEREKHEAERAARHAKMMKKQSIKKTKPDEISLAESVPESTTDEKVADKGGRIVFQSPEELVFTCKQGETVYKTVTFTNTGTVALKYTWRTVVDLEKPNPKTVSQVAAMIANNTLVKLPREHHLAAGRSSVFCMKCCGTALPGETCTTRFAFCSKAAAGVFLETWELDTVPRANIALDTSASASTDRGAAAGTDGELDYGIVTPMQMKVRSHAVEIDTGREGRAHCATAIGNDVARAAAADQQQLQRRKVRTPVTGDDMRARHIRLFEEVNRGWLATLSGAYTTAFPFHVTTERIAAFTEMCERAIACVDEANAAWLSVQATALATFLTASEDELRAIGAIGDAPSSATANKDPKRIKEMKRVLFPERRLESFDEVTMADIVPTWDYDVATLLEVVDGYVATTHAISRLEARIAEQRLKDEKARQKEARRQERLALLDEGEEDEGEEEEEEEAEEVDEEEEKKKPPPPKHPFVAKSEGLRDEVTGHLHLLVTRQLPLDDVRALAQELLGDVLDQFEAFHDLALAAVEANATAVLGPADPAAPRAELVVPGLPSPFTSDVGAITWGAVMKAKPAAPEEGGKGGGKAPPKKGGKPGDAPSADELDKEREFATSQVNLLYKTMYDHVSAALRGATESMFERVDTRWASLALAKARGEAPGAAPAARLLDVAVLRDEDVPTAADLYRKVVFVNFHGEPFAPGAERGPPSAVTESGYAAKSAFDVTGAARVTALQPVLQAAHAGAATVVLVYESLPTDTEPAPFAAHARAVVAEMLRRDTDAMRAASLTYKPKKKGVKMPAPAVVFYDVHVCPTLADLNFRLESPSTAAAPLPGSDPGMHAHAVASTVTVYVVEDLRVPSVVPDEPPLPPVFVTDEEAPIPLGEAESEARREKVWDERRPHRVPALTTGADGGDHSAARTGFTDPAAALCEAVLQAAGRVADLRGSPHDEQEEVTAVDYRAFLPRKDTAVRILDGGQRVLEMDSAKIVTMQEAQQDFYTMGLGDSERLDGSEGAGGEAAGGLVMSAPSSYVWVESTPHALFLSHDAGALRNFNCGHKLPYVATNTWAVPARCAPFGDRVVSQAVRETFLWAGVVQLLPQTVDLLAEAAAALEAEQAALAQYAQDEQEWLALEAAAAAAAEAAAAAAEGGDVPADAAPAEGPEPLPPRPVAPVCPKASPVALHFTRLFASSPTTSPSSSGSGVPRLASPADGARLTVVLGGEIRSDKFRVLDELIDVAHTILLGGEFALPFIALNQRIMLVEYRERLAVYGAVCAHLSLKARARGCRLLLPLDLVTGDMPVSSALTQRCYEVIDKDSRDDAPDYDGDTKVVTIGRKPAAPVAVAAPVVEDDGKSKKGGAAAKAKRKSISEETQKEADIPPPAEKDPDEEMNYVRGYVYDLGPAAVAVLKEEVAAADVLLVWGTVSLAEVGPFQTAHRALVAAAAKKKPAAGADDSAVVGDDGVAENGARAPLHTLLLGESTVEWFARVLDADGEADGDVVGAGRVAYAMRRSALLVGLLGAYRSHVLDGGLVRARPARPVATLPDGALEEGLALTPAQRKAAVKALMERNEWVYNWRRVGEEEDEEEEEEEDEDE